MQLEFDIHAAEGGKRKKRGALDASPPRRSKAQAGLDGRSPLQRHSNGQNSTGSGFARQRHEVPENTAVHWHSLVQACLLLFICLSVGAVSESQARQQRIITLAERCVPCSEQCTREHSVREANTFPFSAEATYNNRVRSWLAARSVLCKCLSAALHLQTLAGHSGGGSPHSMGGPAT